MCGLAYAGYILDNIFCGYMDHWGNYPGGAKFKGHSYARVRDFETGSECWTAVPAATHGAWRQLRWGVGWLLLLTPSGARVQNL